MEQLIHETLFIIDLIRSFKRKVEFVKKSNNV